MAKFLTTTGNSFYIEQIILKADRHLTLCTPYLSLSKNLYDRLIDAGLRNIAITLIYGKSELNEAERLKIESFTNIEVFFCENLHAKCYLNEKSMIITSMNLYEFSERNNREMGILIEKGSDELIFQEALDEI
ncbi:MAG: phospholipase D family protein [Cyclobacteriaceae bacterium]